MKLVIRTIGFFLIGLCLLGIGLIAIFWEQALRWCWPQCRRSANDETLQIYLNHVPQCQQARESSTACAAGSILQPFPKNLCLPRRLAATAIFTYKCRKQINALEQQGLLVLGDYIGTCHREVQQHYHPKVGCITTTITLPLKRRQVQWCTKG